MEEATAGSIAHVIQLAVAPVFLLAGIGAMLGVLSNRLARVVDRARALESKVSPEEEWRAQLLRQGLANFARRARLISWAISLFIGSAILVGGLVVTLFVSSLANLNLGGVVAAMFIGAMLAFISGLLVFLREIYLATSQLRIGEPEGPAPLLPSPPLPPSGGGSSGVSG
jgi:hypothetical protein